jgi:hypothetical protein
MLMNDFKLPEKCKGCPVMAEISSEIASLRIQNTYVTRIGEALVGDTGAEVDAVMRQLFPDLPDDEFNMILSQARAMTGLNMEELSAQLENKEREREARAAWCDTGNLVMRAVKNEREYKVAICTSAYNYAQSHGGLTPTTAHVWVKPKPQE